MDILVILMMAFGLFAILMFILFYIYAKKYYNEKHIIDEEMDNTVNIDAVDISIRGNVITFDANNKNLMNGERVSLMYNNTPCNGIVTRSNYELHLEMGEKIPNRLVLIPKENVEVEYINVNNEKEVNYFGDEIEFVPKKKN